MLKNTTFMFLVRKSLTAPALALLAGLLLVTACTVDKSYDNISPSDIDLSVTVLEEGLTVPIGNTEKIQLEDLLNAAGEGINDFISTGKNGEIILSYDGSMDLTDQISEYNLADMAVLDGIEFTEGFSYHIGDFNADNFSIKGEQYDLKVRFDGMDMLNIKPTPISVSADNLSFHAGLDQYKNVISGNSNMDLGKTIGNVSCTPEILKKSVIDDQVKLIPDPNMEIAVPANVIPNVSVNQQVSVGFSGIKLDDKVTKVSNIKTNPNARMVVTLTLKNACFTAGTVTPNVDLDFSGLLVLSGGSKINLGSMQLSPSNSWTLSKSFAISGLSTTEFAGELALNTKVPITGTVSVSGAKTTKSKVSQYAGNLALDIDVRFLDFTVESAELAITADSVNRNDSITLDGFEGATLPKGIKDVKKIVLDEAKPLVLKITPKNLDKLKQKNLLYEFSLTFPKSFKVLGADANGKITLSGDLADGPVEQQIALSELYPTVSGGKLSLGAKIDVAAKVEPKNLVIDSANLPKSPNEDLSFSVEIEGTPSIKDYIIVLDNYEQPIDMGGNIDFPADGLGDFSGVHVTPKGTPVLTINCAIPEVQGLGLAPGTDGVKISLPDFLVFNGAAIPAQYSFNEADNSITLKNQFPKKIELPIKELFVKTATVNGRTRIVSSYSATGSVTIPGSEVTQSDLESTFGSDIGLSVVLPDIKAQSISLDDDISFDVNQKFTMKLKNVPDANQLQRIDEILLDNVFVNLEATFEGLPTSNDAPPTVDISVKLPDVLEPNVFPIKGKIINNKITAEPLQLKRLSNIDLANVTIEKDKDGNETRVLDIGSIEIAGSISASGAHIDVDQLKSDISADIKASIKNNKTGKISVTKASGVFSYDIPEQVTKLDLSSMMPDMLKGDNLTLDFADPVMNLDIASNLGIPMTANIELVPYIGGNPVEGNIIQLKNIELPYSPTPSNTDKKSFSLCKDASSAPAGRTFLQADINRLLTQIPDYVEVKINAGVVSSATAVLEPSAKYTLVIDYGISVPLTFGEDFKFATETELDLSSAAALVEMGDFTIVGKVVNESPLNLSVTVDLLDNAGTVIPQNTPTSINIQGAATSPVTISLSTSDKSRAVSKAKLIVLVTAVPDKPLKKTDCLQFIDLAAKASGITVDPGKVF